MPEENHARKYKDARSGGEHVFYYLNGLQALIFRRENPSYAGKASRNRRQIRRDIRAYPRRAFSIFVLDVHMYVLRYMPGKFLIRRQVLFLFKFY